VVSFTSRPLYKPEKSSRYPLDRSLGGLQSRSGRHREEKIVNPTGTRTSTLSRPARSQSLYRLRYPGSQSNDILFDKILLLKRVESLGNKHFSVTGWSKKGQRYLRRENSGMFLFKYNAHLKSWGRKPSDIVYSGHTEITKLVPRSGGYSISKHELPLTFRRHGFLRHSAITRFRYVKMAPVFVTFIHTFPQNRAYVSSHP
jgi:hypothetical protein